MTCETCGFDAAYYGQQLRVFEDVVICAWCYADIVCETRDIYARERAVAVFAALPLAPYAERISNTAA